MVVAGSLVRRIPAILLTVTCALPLVRAVPEAQPEAQPEPVPEPTPQGNVYQFSGAVYILGGNGGWCPAEAPQSCGGIPWCCAAGCSCQQLDGGVVGCCPYGGTCQGPAPAVISTVTVYQSYPVTTTVQVVAPTTVQAVTSTRTNEVFANGQPTTTTTTTPPPVVVGGQYCSTLYANGPNLPTTAAGACGTILVVNDAVAMWEDVQKVLWTLGLVWTAMILTTMSGWGVW